MNSSWSFRKPVPRRKNFKGWHFGISSYNRWTDLIAKPIRSKHSAIALAIPSGD